MNKDNISIAEKNNVITPEQVTEALGSLPYNYAKLTYEKLEKWEKQGRIKKSFSIRYIIKVQKQQDGAFNEHILEALVEVGLENIKTRNRFGRATKKTSHSN